MSNLALEALAQELIKRIEPYKIMRAMVRPATMCMHVGHCPFDCSGRLFLHDASNRWFCDICRRAGDLWDLVAAVKSISREDAILVTAREFLEAEFQYLDELESDE